LPRGVPPPAAAQQANFGACRLLDAT
jgi:hypothetical protein